MANPGLNMTLDFSVRDMFFDRLEVARAVERAERRALSRIGAFVRRRARSSLRRRKKTSRPGSPPHVQSRDKYATLKNILFAYDRNRASVVIGPVRIRPKNATVNRGNITVPQIHEFGARVVVHEEQYKGTKNPRQWFQRRHGRTQRPWTRYRTRMASYPARPFMRPALAAEVAAGTITEAWRSTVRAA